MRLIDADALMDSIIEKWGINPKYLDDSLDAMKDVQTLEWINSAPSINIVRCAECKYEPICSHSVQHTTHDAHSVTIGYKSVDFCSYGERECVDYSNYSGEIEDEPQTMVYPQVDGITPSVIEPQTERSE